MLPHTGVVSQGYSPSHPAIDIVCMVGDPIRATHDGYGFPSRSRDMGIVFVLEGKEQIRKTTYSHLSVAAPKGWYKTGDIIGRCGNTGRLTTGPHVHYEIHK